MNRIDSQSDGSYPARIFQAIADPTRLRILSLIITSGQSLCVCEIEDALGVPQYRVSRHLGVLRNMGVVITTKRGTWNYYSLQTDDVFLVDVFRLLQIHLSDPVFARDTETLRLRLSLRAHGRCVVGHVEEEELHALIRSNTTHLAKGRTGNEHERDRTPVSQEASGTE